MALCILGLMFPSAFGKGKDAPVVEASDCTAAAEDERAGRSCDSTEKVRVVGYGVKFRDDMRN
jgi:hypothetical protein